MTSLPPLLITSAITVASEKLARLSSVNDRLKYAAEGIENWLSMVPELKIVLCDGSGYDLTSLVKQRWPGGQIEVLGFLNDSKAVSFLGKGFGEGQIVEYALKNSATLSSHDSFMKCTSKLWVSNFDFIRETCDKTRFNIETKRQGNNQLIYSRVDTRFYCVTKDFYATHLSEAYKSVSRLDKYHIEHAYLRCLLRAGVLNDFMFPTTPIVRGVSGSLGVEHTK